MHPLLTWTFSLSLPFLFTGRRIGCLAEFIHTDGSIYRNIQYITYPLEAHRFMRKNRRLERAKNSRLIHRFLIDAYLYHSQKINRSHLSHCSKLFAQFFVSTNTFTAMPSQIHLRERTRKEMAANRSRSECNCFTCFLDW